MKRTPPAVFLVALVVIGTPFAARAMDDKYHITAEEQAACRDDAIELCSMAYPDEEKLIACMKLNRLSLSEACRPVFEAGMKRRHLN